MLLVERWNITQPLGKQSGNISSHLKYRYPLTQESHSWECIPWKRKVPRYKNIRARMSTVVIHSGQELETKLGSSIGRWLNKLWTPRLEYYTTTKKDASHPLKWLKFKRLTTPNVNKEIKPPEGLCVVGWNRKWYNHFGKRSDSFL